MIDDTLMVKSYEDSMLGDFEEFVDTNLEQHIDDHDSQERATKALLSLVNATGGLAGIASFPHSKNSPEYTCTYLGDVLYYLTAMCSAHGIPLSAVMDSAIEEHINVDYEGNFN